MKDVLTRLGRRIRELRLKAGLTQEQLAERADLHPTYLGGVERGERNLSLNNLDKLAGALHVPLRSLLDFKDKQSHQTLDGVKSLIVEKNSRMELFFAAFCSNCRYLKSFLSLKDNSCHLTFFSLACKNCEPFMTFKDFVDKSEQASDGKSDAEEDFGRR
jgi:transcriptional regulator with XRE-family HTH domain